MLSLLCRANQFRNFFFYFNLWGKWYNFPKLYRHSANIRRGSFCKWTFIYIKSYWDVNHPPPCPHRGPPLPNGGFRLTINNALVYLVEHQLVDIYTSTRSCCTSRVCCPRSVLERPLLFEPTTVPTQVNWSYWNLCRNLL